MAIDKKNQKFCRVPLERDELFSNSVLATGSVYFRPSNTTVVVGDGATKGGIEFPTRSWVLQQISNARWEVIAKKETFSSSSNAGVVPLAMRIANSLAYININATFNISGNGSIV